MNWFNNHPNWALFIAWIIGNGLIYLGRIIAPLDGSLAFEWISLFILAFILILGAEIWCLIQKRRSIWYFLIPFIGLFIILSLENKRIIKDKEYLDNQKVLLENNGITPNSKVFCPYCNKSVGEYKEGDTFKYWCYNCKRNLDSNDIYN